MLRQPVAEIVNRLQFNVRDGIRAGDDALDATFLQEAIIDVQLECHFITRQRAAVTVIVQITSCKMLL